MKSDSGWLSLSIADGSAKTILPDADLVAASYDVIITSPGFDPVQRLGLGTGTTTIERIMLRTGDWRVTVNARNASGELIGTGFADIAILPGQTSPVSIGVGPLTGPGVLVLNASIAAGLAADPLITGSLVPADGGTPIDFSLLTAADRLSAQYIGSSIPADYYEMILQFKDGATTIVTSAPEALRIADGKTTTGTLGFTWAEPGVAGQVRIAVEVDLQPAFAISLSGAESIYYEGDSLTVTANPSEAVDAWRWYLDGTEISGATSATLDQSTAGLGYGLHRLVALGMNSSKVASLMLPFSFALRPTVATPTISPAGGVFVGAQSVSLSCATAGATIRYTTDGSYPGASGGTAYSGPFTLSASATVNAIAYLSRWTASALVTSSLTINSGVTNISGVLGGADLIWTKAKSPYRVIGNLRVEAGSSLLIDPGTEIQFAGNYYLECYGTISAVGTAAEHIVFKNAADFAGTWISIGFRTEATSATADAGGAWTGGSRFAYVDITGAAAPFQGVGGKYHLESSALRFSSTASSTFGTGTASGIIVDCEITNALPSGTIIGGSIHDVYEAGTMSGTMKDTVLYSLWASGTFSATIENCIVDRAHTLSFNGSTITGLTVNNAAVLDLGSSVWNSSHFENISQSIYFPSTSTQVSGSDFATVALLTSTAPWSVSTPSIDLRGNYFRAAATTELDAMGVNVNKSFTQDYWDDFSLAKLDLSGYLSSAPAGVGYQGTAYIGPDVRDTIASTLVSVQGGSSDSIPNGNANGTWSVSAFQIGRYEVTQAQYLAVMGTNPASYYGDTSMPVENVNWYNAVEFCNRLSLHAGLMPVYSYSGYGTNPGAWPSGWTTTTHNNIAYSTIANGYRLPTEAEWEWAARGGTASLGSTYAGGATIEDVGWIAANSTSTTHAVGGKLPNELGLYDMSGNVFEWCWDWYDSIMAGTDPVGAYSSSYPYRVLRGGSFNGGGSYARVGDRSHYYYGYPSYAYYYCGFRVARGSP